MAPLIISRQLHRHLMAELARRGDGQRESGAFLLGPAESRRITTVAFYDDLDPTSLTGGIQLHAAGYTRLNILCRATSLQVFADIHTHPGDHTQQSGVDARNPMVAIAGHVALIAPDFARGPKRLHRLGAHTYLGSGRWELAQEARDIIRHTTLRDLLRLETRDRA
jgi:hypothetical protein